jgi:ABC-2 type transport system ATP-binding protein
MTTKDEAIHVQNVVKRFGDFTAVDGVSFTVHRGEIFGILGPNGAGKTTILEIIEGLQNPTTGQTTVLNFDTRRDANKVKENIGVQLQASAYFEYLTLIEILRLFGRFYQKQTDPMRLLEKVGLTEKAMATVGSLSGGQRQRFIIAAALVNDPEVVFLDEPTTGLDPQARQNLWGFIREMHAEGRTIILTTHYMEEAQLLCHRVAIMDHGKIVALDSPANLVRGLPVPYQIKFAASTNGLAEELMEVDSVQGVNVDPEGIYHLRSSDAAATLQGLFARADVKRIQLSHIEVTPTDLEEVFLTLTGRQLRD